MAAAGQVCAVPVRQGLGCLRGRGVTERLPRELSRALFPACAPCHEQPSFPIQHWTGSVGIEGFSRTLGKLVRASRTFWPRSNPKVTRAESKLD